jgi:hypothetical protein
MAPALALLTAGLRGAQFLEDTSRPAAPRHQPLRKMAPKFCCVQSKHSKVEANMVVSLSRKEGTKAHRTQAPAAAQDGAEDLLRELQTQQS